MSLPVWPILGSYGFSGADAGSGAIAELYPDNSIRIYKKSSSSPNRNTLTIVHKRISQSDLATLRSFFATNKYTKVWVYDPSAGVTKLTFTPDGSSSIGRHTALFFKPDGSEPELDWENAGQCSYNVTVQFTLLD